MSDNSKRVLPKLRFPEFEGSAKWGVMPLSKLATKQTERNHEGAISAVLTNSAEHGVVNQRDYFDKDIANQANLENYFIVRKGDYVYNPRISSLAPVGPISKNNVADGVMSPLYTVFRFNSEDNEFYSFYFSSTAWHMYMRQVSSTGARHDRMAISNSDFLAMPLPVPAKQEQQKVADCLSSLDILISAHKKKYEQLQRHKKGLMQNLFPPEGESVPAFRLPEFKGGGDWKNETVGDICQSFSGGTPSSTDAQNYGGDIPFIRSAEIDKDDTELNLTNKGLRESSAKMVKKGDILYALYGANSGEVAIARLNGAINQAILCLRPKANSEFICQFLKFKKDRIVDRYIQGGQGNLSGEIIKSICLSIPPTMLEQQKIADCLATVDEVIHSEAENIEHLRAQKKGLMQLLFPAADEVAS